MSEFELFAATLIIFLSIVAMVFFFSSKLWISWYRGHSQLGQMAIQSMAAWTTILMIAGLFFFIFGNKIIPSLTYLCCFAGTLPIIRLQYSFKMGRLMNIWTSRKQPVFDERDYRIGQEALQTAYFVFWILVCIVGLSLHMIWALHRLELPYWSVMLILPVIAMTVSIVHTSSILVLYRRDNRETVEDGRGERK